MHEIWRFWVSKRFMISRQPPLTPVNQRVSWQGDQLNVPVEYGKFLTVNDVFFGRLFGVHLERIGSLVVLHDATVLALIYLCTE